MNSNNKIHIERVVRVVADFLMVSVAFAIPFLIRRLFYGATGSLPDSFPMAFEHYWVEWLLTVSICLMAFAGSGFYTSGRYYTSKYKAIIVFQAVSIAYLLISTLTFMLYGFFTIPKSVLLMGWGFTLLFVGGARLWSWIWRKVTLIAPVSSTKRNPNEIRQINKVLVVGGAGYVGSGLLPRMLDRGYKVRLLDMMMFGDSPIQNIIDHPNLEVIRSDFRQVDKVVEAMHGVDAVIHLGGIVGDPACALDEKVTIDVNLMATRMIAEIAKGYGVQRFIFASTCSVYGASDEILDEHSLLNPVSLYAKTKIASEQVLHQLAGSDFFPVILRFGTIYGFSGRTRFDLVVNLLTAKAFKEGKITVFGGDQWRPFLHVNDAAKAVFTVLEADIEVVKNQTFNVGSDEQNKTLGQVGEMIRSMCPSAELLDMGQDGDRRNYRANFKKIRTVLGFTPDWTLEAGIQQVLDALRLGQVKDYKNPIYSNVQFMKEGDNSELLKQLEKDQDFKLLELFDN
jgi:nucleoside-diphosphate-sugar epimerase